MSTLIIYDSTGKIYYMASGAVTEPTGIPFLWVDVPDGKYIKSVDVSGETPAAVLENIPLSEVEQEIVNLQTMVALMDAAQNYNLEVAE